MDKQLLDLRKQFLFAAREAGFGVLPSGEGWIAAREIEEEMKLASDDDYEDATEEAISNALDSLKNRGFREAV